MTKQEKNDQRWLDLYNLIDSLYVDRVFPQKHYQTLVYFGTYNYFVDLCYHGLNLSKLEDSSLITINNSYSITEFCKKNLICEISGLDRLYNWSIENNLIIAQLCVFNSGPAIEFCKLK